MSIALLTLSALLSVAHAADVDADGCDDAYEGNGACVSVDAVLGAGTTVGASSDVRAYATVGADVAIGANVVIGERSTLGGRDVTVNPLPIGDGTVIGRRAFIGDDFDIAGGVTVSRALSAGDGLELGSGAAIGYGATLGDDVTVGTNATLGSLVTLGNHASVGASAVLARSVTVLDAATPSLGSQINGIVGPDTIIGPDVLIEAGARVRKQANIADGVDILSTARVGREARIHTGASVAGVVRTGATIEAGATVPSDAVIARNATVCANTTVPGATSVGSGETYPASGCALPVSCAEILANGNSTGSHSYTIDPDGSGPVEPIDAYCDMDTAPGGWTLVWHSYSGNVEADANERFTVTSAPVVTDPLARSAWVNLIPVAGNVLLEDASVLRYEYQDQSGNISGSDAHQNVTATGDFSGLFTSPSPSNYVSVVATELHGAQRQINSGARVYWGNCTVYSTALRFETFRDGTYWSNDACHTDSYGNGTMTVGNMDFSSFNDSHSRAWGTIQTAGWGVGASTHVGNIWVR